MGDTTYTSTTISTSETISTSNVSNISNVSNERGIRYMQKIEAISYFPTSDFKTINQMLEQTIARHGRQTAVVYRDTPKDEPSSISYEQLGHDIEALIQALAKIDASPGDELALTPPASASQRRIAIAGENSYYWMLSYYAAVTALGTVIPLDRLLQAGETYTLLERSEADTLVVDASIYLKMLETEDLNTLPHLKHIILMLPERVAKADVDRLDALLNPEVEGDKQEQLSIHLFKDLLANGHKIVERGRVLSFAEPDPEAPLILIFTSGTTANSKGVLLTHRSLCANMRGLEGMVKFPGIQRMLSVLPLSHTFENTCGMLFAMNIGAEIYIADGLRYIQQNMQEYKISLIIGVPNIFDAFYNRIWLTAKKGGSEKKLNLGLKISRILRKFGIDRRRKLFSEVHAAFGGELAYAIVGAAAVNPEVSQFFDDIGVRIMQGYGLTETSPVVAGCNTQLLVNGSVGVPLPGVEVAIDTDVPGEPGEILVRGDLLMSGYYKDEEATAEVMDADGWFHTGDLGQISADTGVLFIKGRLKSMIVLESGKKVFPEEIEQLISEHKSGLIKDALVFSQLDDRGDTVITAKFILDEELVNLIDAPVRQKTIQDQLEQLVTEINAKMPGFKRVRSHFYSFKDMIRTTTLKVKRPAEIARNLDIMKRLGLDWKQLSGKNLDDFNDTKTDSPS